MHNGPTNPWSESNSASLRQSQGDSDVTVGGYGVVAVSPTVHPEVCRLVSNLWL